MRVLIQKLFWSSDEGFRIALCVASRHDISIPFKFGELLGGDCSFSRICGQFSWRHGWETRAMRAEPHACCWICRSVWQHCRLHCTVQWTLEAEIHKHLNYVRHQYPGPDQCYRHSVIGRTESFSLVICSPFESYFVLVFCAAHSSSTFLLSMFHQRRRF